MSSWADTGLFLREFVRDPLHTAAVAPSSPALAAAMTAPLLASGPHPVIVELGPGTGSFTRAIQQRIGGRGRHVAVELHPGWAQLLQERHPDVDVVRGDVRELAAILADRGVTRVDAVVSGLPWVAYTPAPGGRPLHAVITDVLAPTGVFTQFAYTWSRWAPPARRQLGDLRAHFGDVVISPTVWRNMPPAVVYEARRPR
ncbi:class I SAM-dependent methyltransferase [Pseudonocardia sp. GCM10023141]|uniref:class I SAM-dependent methyltransferase n=1 Tax=Pseudonocardia sp. GCM10023141 TaxID=3252653 RepID=UPI0036155E47